MLILFTESVNADDEAVVGFTKFEASSDSKEFKVKRISPFNTSSRGKSTHLPHCKLSTCIGIHCSIENAARLLCMLKL